GAWSAGAALLEVLWDKSDDEFVRGSAAEALGPGGAWSAGASAALLEVLRDRSDEADVRWSAARALGAMGAGGAGSAGAGGALLEVLRDKSDGAGVRWLAADALGRFQSQGLRYFQQGRRLEIRPTSELARLDYGFMNEQLRNAESRAARRYPRRRSR